MFKGLLFFFRTGWKYDKRYILWNILSQLLSSLSPILAALMPKLIIDELMGARQPERIIFCAAAFAGWALLSGALSSFFTHDGFIRRCRVSNRFDAEQHRRLALADLERLESPAFRDMKEKANKFLTCDWHGFGYLLDCALKIIGQSITLIGLTAVIASLSPWIVITFSLLAVGSVWFEGKTRKKALALAQTVISNQRKWMYYSSAFEETKFAKEIRLNRLAHWLLQKERTEVECCTETLKNQHDLFIRADAITAASTFVQQCVSYVYLIRQVLANIIGIGDFTMYTGAVTAFAGALRQIMNSIVEIRAYDMYYDHLDEYLNVPMRLRQGECLPLPKGCRRIEFRNVSFRYAGAEKWALRHINLILEPGEKLSIVGENGSGKTTFAKLLLRLYDPTEGEILLDGMDIRRIDCDQYTELFSAVFQDFQLLAMSLRDNIALGLPVSDDQILHALDQVRLTEFVRSLPRGLDTHIDRLFDENGVIPSGGEGQRIALARALIRNTPVILLDEPTAALDPRAEYEIYQGFHALTEGKTAVYISHRLSSARFCDRIAVLHEGRLAEYGTHDELILLNGRYADLYRMQAQFYI